MIARPLRQSVLAIVVIAFAALMAVLSIAGLRLAFLADQRAGLATLDAREALWGRLIETTLNRIEIALTVARADIIGAVERKDEAALKELLEPVASRVRRVEVKGADGEILFSTAPSGTPPIGPGKPARGIIDAAADGLVAIVSMPLAASDGRLVGVITVTSDLAPTLYEIKAATKAEAFLLDHSGRMVAGTDANLAQRVDMSGLGQGRHGEIRRAGKSNLDLELVPVRSADGHTVGSLVTVEDATAAESERQFISLVALAGASVILVLLLVLLSGRVRRSLAPLDEVSRVLDALAAGDTSARMEARKGGEGIGRFAGAVGAIRDALVRHEMEEQRDQRRRRRQGLFLRLRLRDLAQMLDGKGRAAVLADLALAEAASEQRDDIPPLAKAFHTLSEGLKEQYRSLQTAIAERGRDIDELEEALRSRGQPQPVSPPVPAPPLPSAAPKVVTGNVMMLRNAPTPAPPPKTAAPVAAPAVSVRLGPPVAASSRPTPVAPPTVKMSVGPVISAGPSNPPPKTAPAVQVRVTAPPPPAPPVASHSAQRVEVIIANDLAELSRLAREVDAYVARCRLPAATAFNLNLCLDELVTNIISYGYDDQRRHDIRVRLAFDGKELVTEVTDDGKPFDPFRSADEGASASDAMRSAGLGLALVKDFMDATAYRREDRRNIVTLSKRIGDKG